MLRLETEETVDVGLCGHVCVVSQVREDQHHAMRSGVPLPAVAAYRAQVLTGGYGPMPLSCCWYCRASRSTR
eukprot:1401664-Rhodomonas_salina.1